MRLGFSGCKKIHLKRRNEKKKKKKKTARELSNDAIAMFSFFFSFFFCIFSFDSLYKSIRCGCSFELHRQVDAIQMSTHNICLYNEVDKKTNKKKKTGCNRN